MFDSEPLLVADEVGLSWHAPSEMPNTTVGIVEDDEVLRSALRRLIGEAPSCRCVATCATGEEGLEKLPPLAPDVVLMDLNLPQMSGTECIARLKELVPATQVIVLTVYEDSEHIFQALKAGASGYLLKRSEPEEVIEAIKNAKEGGAPMSSQIARRVVQSFHKLTAPGQATTALTDRETEILAFLSKGFANKEIADKLQISVPTVRTHLRHIYEKLHVRSRTEAIVKFLK